MPKKQYYLEKVYRSFEFLVLPSLYRDRYQQLLEHLLALKESIDRENQTPPAWKQRFQTAKQVYQSEIINLNSDGLEPAIASRWQSIQTELNRTFRLLQTDIIFLQAARQSATTEQRRANCQQHLDRLLAGCEAILDLNDD